MVALSQPLAERLKLAPVVLLAVIGAAMGAVSGVLLHGPLSNHFGEFVRLFADLPLGSETFIYVFLPLLVFEAAFTSDVRRILEDAAPILMLAVDRDAGHRRDRRPCALAVRRACRSSSACCSARSSRPPTPPRSSRFSATSGRRRA